MIIADTQSAQHHTSHGQIEVDELSLLLSTREERRRQRADHDTAERLALEPVVRHLMDVGVRVNQQLVQQTAQVTCNVTAIR